MSGAREVYDFLKKVGSFYLATCEGGQPRVRIFSNIDLFEERIYLLTGKVKAVSRQLFANPGVELIAYDGEVWVRIAATAANDDRASAKQHVIDANPLLKDWFRADDDNTHVFYLKGARARFESLFGQPRDVEF